MWVRGETACACLCEVWKEIKSERRGEEKWGQMWRGGSSGEDYQDSCRRSSYSYNSLAGVQIPALYLPSLHLPVVRYPAYLCLSFPSWILSFLHFLLIQLNSYLILFPSITILHSHFFAICQNHNTDLNWACIRFLKVRFDVTAKGWEDRERTVSAGHDPQVRHSLMS